MQGSLLPLSKEQFSEWVKQIASQHSKGAIIIDNTKEGFPIQYCNDAFLTMSGYKAQEVIGQSIHFFNGSKTSIESSLNLQQLLEKQDPFQEKFIQYKADGTAFWHELTCYPMKDVHNEVQCILIYCEDKTSSTLNRMISKLEVEVYGSLDIDGIEGQEQNFYQIITEKIEAHYLHDMYCTIQLIHSPSSLEVVGYGSLPTRIAQQLTEDYASLYTSIVEDHLTQVPFNQSSVTYKQYLEKDREIKISSCWIKPIFNNQHTLKGFVTLYFEKELTANDQDHRFLNRLVPLILVAQKYNEQKQELRKLAYYDTSINIPNAHFFRLKMEEWIKQGHEGIVILIQPSEYSKIVDLYGRSIGDDLLKQMVERLNLHRGNHQEFIARFSNSLIIGSRIPHAQLHKYESRVRPLTIIPYFLAEKDVYITLKIGVGYFTKDSTVDDSIRQADIALSKARQNPGTSTAYFKTEIDEELKQEMETLNELTNGLKNNEFTINVQPKMNIKTGRIDGFEALSRWNSKKLGAVPPSTFIPLAEQSGLIKDIDNAVLRKTLSWLEHRYKNNLKLVPVAINISPDHFYDDQFLTNFKTIIKEYDIPLKFLKLELTESIELVDFTKAKAILNELKQFGIDCSIDDFGVGFSSLSYLPKLPFSEIKIDRSFVNSMNDPGMYAVIQTIIQLASNLQMKAVAEGIETLEQYIMLKNMGCHIGQGFFLHKPMPLEVASALLDSL